MVRFLDQARAFLEATSRAVEHRFDLNQAARKICFCHLGLAPPAPDYCPACADATLLFAAGAARICSVAAPLSTMRVSGSHTVERMPTGASARPASSSMLVSEALRGAGPPNKASIACCCASLGVSPAVPATGGARLKSGGMISGALRATANSSGARRLPVIEAHPLVASADTRMRAVRALRMFDSLLGAWPFSVILTAQERAQQQDHDGNANRRIADIEYQKWAEVAEMKICKVDDIAEPHAVDDVAERSPQHHSERRLVDAVLLSADPDRDADGDCCGEGDQHPAANRVGRVQQAERNPLVAREGEVEDRQQHQLVADLVEPKRVRDEPFRELVERK